MGAYHHWLGDLARAAVAAGLLLLWHGQAKAACDADIVESMVLSMQAPATEHSAPCCAVASLPALAAEKLRVDAPPAPGAALPGREGLAYSAAARLPDPPLPDRPWRPYCARSARLLR